MPAHLRPPERRAARPLGALAIALGIALLVVASLGGEPGEEGDTELVHPATEASTEPTVLGEAIEPSTTVPDAPPASAAGFTTTTATDDDGSGGGGTSRGTNRLTSPPTTLGPAVTTTRPALRTTTTTALTTTTTAPTTTTEEPTTTTETTTTAPS